MAGARSLPEGENRGVSDLSHGNSKDIKPSRLNSNLRPLPLRHGPAPAFAGAGFVRATGRGTVLVQVARTSRAMTVGGRESEFKRGDVTRFRRTMRGKRCARG